MGDNLLKLFLFIQKINIKTAFLSKADLLVNVIMMMINNFSFIFMWWIIFKNKTSINGWVFDDMALMFAVFNLGFAFYALCMRGIERIPECVENGGLDNYILTPRNSLFMLATSESTFANWGDVFTGLLMFFISAHHSLDNFFIFIFCSLLASILIFSFRLILACLAFSAPNSEQLGKNIFMAFLTFASQPASIFTGWYKVMFLTIIPSGFISLYPVNLIKSFNLLDFIIMSLGIFIFFIISRKMFYLGLKKYASGNRFGIR